MEPCGQSLVGALAMFHHTQHKASWLTPWEASLTPPWGLLAKFSEYVMRKQLLCSVLVLAFLQFQEFYFVKCNAVKMFFFFSGSTHDCATLT